MFSIRVGGYCLVVASILFWCYWYLMPQPGTVDASYILEAVTGQRGSVLLSAILQTLCAIAIIPAVLSISEMPSRLVQVGVVLLLIGALGNAADAVYHQMAYEMTAPDVDRPAMLPVMTRMQTGQIWLLAPLLLAFFPGAVCLTMGLARTGLVSRRLCHIQLAALVVAVAGVVVAKTTGTSPRVFSLTALALFGLALGWTGLGIARAGGA